MNTVQESKSVYRRGADDGFIFGVYLSLLFILEALAVTGDSALCALTAGAMMLAVPVMIYFFLRRGYDAEGRRSQFSALWLHGICIFFFGSLLMALTAYVYMRLVHPSFIPEVFTDLQEAYNSIDTPAAHEMAVWIEKVQTNNLYPPAAEIAVSFIWTAVFTGSMLSMLLSLLIRAFHPAKRTTPPPMQ